MHIASLLNDDHVGSLVKTRGWVYRWRESGPLVFIIVRDSTNIIQAIVERGKLSDDDFETAKKLTIESSIELEGNLVKEKKAPTGYEIHVSKLTAFNIAEKFPITKDKSDEFLLDIRHLWLRSREMTATLKIRETIFETSREYFKEKGYHEVHTPMFVGAAVEGGSTLFEVPYFGEKAYLTQSSQFYLEAFIYSLEKVYTISPSFRAEKSRTRRHLTEFSHLEAESAWMSNQEMMTFEEEMIVRIASDLLDKRKDELSILKRDPEKLKNIETPFYRYTYEKIIDLGRSKGMDLPDIVDLGEKEEREITEGFDKPLFVYNFPTSLKPFYHRPDPDDPAHVLCHDMLAPEGYGEIIGGGERIWNKDELLRRISENGLNTDDYGWYIDLRRFGSVPHSGFGLGMDRVLTWIAGLEHIKNAVPFPRTIRRLRP